MEIQKRTVNIEHVVDVDTSRQEYSEDVTYLNIMAGQVSGELVTDVDTMTGQLQLARIEHVTDEAPSSQHGSGENISDIYREHFCSLLNPETNNLKENPLNVDREQDNLSIMQNSETDALKDLTPFVNKEKYWDAILTNRDAFETLEMQAAIGPSVNVMQVHTDDIQKDNNLKSVECAFGDCKAVFNFECEICSKRFDKVSELYAHLKTHESHKTVVNSEKTVENIADLNMQNNTDANTFKCGVCFIEFPSMTMLHNHMVTEENISDYSYNNVTQMAIPCTRRTEEDESETEDIMIRPKDQRCKKSNAEFEEIEKPDGTTVCRGKVNEEIRKINFRHFTLKEAYGKKSWQTIVATKKRKVENHFLGGKSVVRTISNKKGQVKYASMKEVCDSPVQNKKISETYTCKIIDFNFENDLKNQVITKLQPMRTPSSNTRSRVYNTRQSIAVDSAVKRVDYKVLAGLASPKSRSAKKASNKDMTPDKQQSKVDNVTEVIDKNAAHISNGDNFYRVKDNSYKVIQYNEIESQILGKDEEEYDDGDNDDDFMDDCNDVDYNPEKNEAFEDDDETKDKFKIFIKDIKEKNYGQLKKAKQLFACEECGKVFDFKAMKRHKSAHSQIRNFKCPKCGKGYKCRQHVRDHIRSVHYVIKVRCQICQKVFRGKQSFAKHTTTHILKKEISDKALDEIEGEIVMEDDDLMDWNKIKDEVKVVEEISVPDNVRQDDSDITAGAEVIGRCIENKVEKIFECHLCRKTFPNKSSLSKHSIVHSDIRAFDCDMCHVAFKSEQLLREHAKKAHKSTGSVVCDICGESAKSDYALWCHKSKHLMSNDPHYSEQVVQQLQAEDELRKQKKKKKTFTSERKVNCHECGFVVPTKRLKRHIETHTKTKEFQCELCKKFFKTINYLKDHKKKTHSWKRSEVCYICGLSFKSKKYLLIHIQIHGPKDKICDYCGKGFTTELYRKVHMQTHGEKKGFKCPECPAGFTHRTRLMIHLTEKHGKGDTKPCKYCGESFPSRQKARMHERLSHEGYKPPKRFKSRSLHTPMVNDGNIQQTVKQGDGQEYQVMINTSNSHDGAEIMELGETADIQVIQVSEISGQLSNGEERDKDNFLLQTSNETGLRVVEQVIEIPESAQQCQILLFPDGSFQLLNIVDQ